MKGSWAYVVQVDKVGAVADGYEGEPNEDSREEDKEDPI